MQAHRSSPNRTSPLTPLTLVAVLLTACGGSEAGTTEAADSPGSSPSSTGGDVEAQLSDLVRAVTPAAPATTVAEKNAWFGRRKELIERLREGSEELGRAALARYQNSPDAIPEVHKGLLDVAAHTATEATTPVLVELLTTYGADLGVRAMACDLLGETAPEAAIETIEPILLDDRRRTTYPPEDKLVASYALACKSTGKDPVPVIAQILTEPNQPMEARHRAATILADYDVPQSRQALEHVIVESGGNHYLRKKATQALRKLLPEGEFCTLIRRIMEREADTNFQVFLADNLDRFCPQ